MVKSSKKVLAVLLAVACLITFMPAMASQSFAAKKLTVKPAKKTIYVKKSVTLKANQKVKWSASKASLKVVKLTSKKAKSVKVTGKKAGKAVVTAKVGKQTKKVTITVKKAKVKKPVAAEPTFAGIENVQTEYGLATTANKRTEAVTKADLLKGVTAKAADGTDLTSSISVSISAGTDEYSNIPTNSAAQASVAKSYTVTYSVTDAAGKTATKSIKVIVRNQAPSLTVANITCSFKTEALNAVETDLVNAGVKAVDDYETFPADTKATDKTVANFENAFKDKDGKPAQTVKVTKVTDSTGAALTRIEGTGANKKEVVDFSKIDFTKAGTYTITFTATDVNGAKDSKTATLTIQQNQAPVIDTTKTIEVAKDLTKSENDVKLAVWKQVVINDAEDGTDVKPNKDKNTVDAGNVIFKDASGKTLTFAQTEDFYKKLASVTLNNVKDSDGANAQTATVPVKVVDGLVLTASNQTLNVNASSTGNIDLMKFISATYNGEAYALTGTTTLTTDANTTVKVNGKDQTTVPENTSANYNVEYIVNYKDGTTIVTATKTIKVSVVDKAAVDAVVAKINAITTATKGDYADTVNAAKTAYDKLSVVNQNAIPQSTYKILQDALAAQTPSGK